MTTARLIVGPQLVERIVHGLKNGWGWSQDDGCSRDALCCGDIGELDATTAAIVSPGVVDVGLLEVVEDLAF